LKYFESAPPGTVPLGPVCQPVPPPGTVAAAHRSAPFPLPCSAGSTAWPGRAAGLGPLPAGRRPLVDRTPLSPAPRGHGAGPHPYPLSAPLLGAARPTTAHLYRARAACLSGQDPKPALRCMALLLPNPPSVASPPCPL
jgi:hypothetical protein